MSRVVVAFGQFGAVADPKNLPSFHTAVVNAGHEAILVQHFATQQAIQFLRGYPGKVGLVGASLGAGAVPIWAGYLQAPVNFVGGFQPSDFDPVMHTQLVDGEELKCVTVPKNVAETLCFRNPMAIATEGLGHATYILDAKNKTTQLKVVNRLDPHPGDFGPAADLMLTALLRAIKE